jgi:hypothetical protein
MSSLAGSDDARKWARPDRADIGVKCLEGFCSWVPRKSKGKGKGKARQRPKVHQETVGCFATARDQEPEAEAEGYATDGSQGD